MKKKEDEVTIWKYSLNVTDRQSLNMPIGSRLLTVQIQHGQLNLWALVDPKIEDREDRIILKRGTGRPIERHPGLLVYISTVQDLGGNSVWHFFEEI